MMENFYQLQVFRSQYKQIQYLLCFLRSLAAVEDELVVKSQSVDLVDLTLRIYVAVGDNSYPFAIAHYTSSVRIQIKMQYLLSSYQFSYLTIWC